MTRRRYERQALREARRVRDSGADAGASMRLAVLVALALVAVAVAAGFQGDLLAGVAAEVLSGLEPLTRPMMFGASALELIAVLVIVLIAGGVTWRAFRR